jgi:hypothetical protein
MIPQYIEQWRAVAPWTFDAQVEQYLVIALNIFRFKYDFPLKYYKKNV